jgi:MarR family transcriptional regulator for hemolysin
MSIVQVIGYQVTRVNLLSLSNFERAVGGPFKLGKVEYSILQLVREGQCNTLSQLAKELQMSAPSASVWLDKLSARRLLKRSKSDTDGRTQHLQVTDSGTALIARAHEALLKAEQQMLSHLSPGERAMLFEILHKLCAQAHRS